MAQTSIVTLELLQTSVHKSSLIKLFTQFRRIVHTHSLRLTMKFSNFGSIVIDTPMLFLHSTKLRAFPLSVVNVSLHYLPRRLCSTVKCNKTPSTIFRSEALKICCHVIVTQ